MIGIVPPLNRIILVVLLVAVTLCFPSHSWSQVTGDVERLTAEIERLRTENQTLRRENERLMHALAQLKGSGNELDLPPNEKRPTLEETIAFINEEGPKKCYFSIKVDFGNTTQEGRGPYTDMTVRDGIISCMFRYELNTYDKTPFKPKGLELRTEGFTIDVRSLDPSKVSVEKTGSAESCVIRLKTTAGKKLVKATFSRRDGKEETMESDASIYCPDREKAVQMARAFKHLITLYGGKPSSKGELFR